MKTSNIKMIAVSILLTSFSINSFAQTIEKTTKNAVRVHPKLEKNKVPTIITETYLREYPVTTYENWYGYANSMNESEWYWYDPYLYSEEYPEYYVVEFTKENIPHKAIYSKAGKKIATHKRLDKDLPKEISTAISKGEYKSWKLLKEKEEIFKDSESDNMKVYKVEVENGKEKHILFYLANGNLLKDKKVTG
jgi:hypothetical protein